MYEIIAQFQEDQNLEIYPADPKQIIEKNGWYLIPYTDFHSDLMEISEDGFTYYYEGRYFIYYNTMKPSNRIRFTLFHEIGHIILNHHTEFKKEILQNSGDTGFMESEANIAARNLMAPAHIIRNLYTGIYPFLSDIFKMSDEAVTNRMKWVNKDYKEVKYKNSSFLFPEIERLNKIFEDNYLYENEWQSRCIY